MASSAGQVARRCEQYARDAEFWEAFRHCLDGLPQTHEDRCFHCEKWTITPRSSSAKTLQISAGNLGVLLYRARMGLRRCLEVNWFCTETDEV